MNWGWQKDCSELEIVGLDSWCCLCRVWSVQHKIRAVASVPGSPCSWSLLLPKVFPWHQKNGRGNWATGIVVALYLAHYSRQIILSFPSVDCQAGEQSSFPLLGHSFQLLCSVFMAQAFLPVNSWRAGGNWAARGSEGGVHWGDSSVKRAAVISWEQEAVWKPAWCSAYLCRVVGFISADAWAGWVCWTSQPGSCGQGILLHLTSVSLV